MPKTEFSSPLALFQFLLSQNEGDMPARLAKYAQPHTPLYRDTLALISAHQQNQDGTVIHALLDESVNELVDDQVVHNLLHQQIGPYQLISQLGQGGMGVVYLGERNDGKFEQKVAIKFVYPSIIALAGEAFLQQEAEHLASLSHPNIAKIYTIDAFAKQYPCIVMEYVHGLPIDVYCQQHNLSLDARLRLFKKVCSAVQSAHNNLLIHADIKPSNILVDKTGDIKLMDFGIARRIENLTHAHLQQAPEQAKEQAKAHAMQAASYQYASPEQLAGKSLTVASDIYSAAKVLSQLVTELITTRSTRHLWLKQTLALCLDDEPAKRISSFEELNKGLSQITRLQAPAWITPTLWQSVNAFTLRNTRLSIATALFSLVVLVFMLKLVAQNNALKQQNASNQQVIRFLTQLFGKEAQPAQQESVFALLSQNQHQGETLQQLNALADEYQNVFSAFVFSNHSVEVGEAIALPVINDRALPSSYTLEIQGEGRVTNTGYYQHSFNQVGVHQVKLVAKHNQRSEVLSLNFVVRDDKRMPFSFSDVPSHDQDFAEIHYLALKGIVIGRPGERPTERIFSPEKLVNQAEALKIIMLAAQSRHIVQLQKSANHYQNLVIINQSSGVEDFSWAATFLDAAFDLGIVADKHSFNPKKPASKEWIAHVLVKTLRLLDPQYLSDEPKKSFTDDDAFTQSEYATSASISTFYNLLGQFNTAFEPEKPLTRRNVALIASKILRLPVLQQNLKKSIGSKNAASTENQLTAQLPDLQTPTYKRVGNTIVALEQNDPSLTSIELKQNANNEFVLLLTNTENNVSNAISVPYNILQ